MTKRNLKVVEIGGEVPTNGAENLIEMDHPYVASVTIEGVCPILFHRWNCEAVKAKGDAVKGSKAKKTDDLETYVWRNDAGEICLPGEYLRGAVLTAARFRQDPRSPRKSALDLFKAAIVSLTEIASFGKDTWDYEDQRRVTVQRQGITRTRPAMKTGWRAEIDLMVNLPQYVSPHLLNEVLTDAGRLVGVGDFRPTYGRFQLVGFQVR